MTACVVIDFIFVMATSKITPLHKMRLLVVTEVEKLVTRRTIWSVIPYNPVRPYGIGTRRLDQALAVDITVRQVRRRNYTYLIGKLSQLLRCISYGAAGEDFLKDHVLNGALYTIHDTFCKQTKRVPRSELCRASIRQCRDHVNLFFHFRLQK